MKILLAENMPESLVSALEDLGQQRTESFVPAFVDAFRKSDWLRYSNGDHWP